MCFKRSGASAAKIVLETWTNITVCISIHRTLLNIGSYMGNFHLVPRYLVWKLVWSFCCNTLSVPFSTLTLRRNDWTLSNHDGDGNEDVENKRSNWQNNSPARAFWNFVHFLAVLFKTTTWNRQNLRRLRTETATANYFNFHLELNAAFIRHAEVELWRRMRQ